jgi:hypothetical protein
MKDSEKVILTSFLYALARQEKPLPEAVQSRLNAIADSYGKNIAALRDIALENVSLQPFYQQSFAYLLDSAQERKMGSDFLPAENPERENAEIENITRDPNTEIDRLERIIKNIETKLDRSRAILADSNSVNSARKELLL